MCIYYRHHIIQIEEDIKWTCAVLIIITVCPPSWSRRKMPPTPGSYAVPRGGLGAGLESYTQGGKGAWLSARESSNPRQS